MTELEIRRLDSGEITAALELTARAFINEPFIIGLFGTELTARYAAAREMYLQTPRHPDDIVAGAFIDGALVGVAAAEPRHGCHHCPGDTDSMYAINAAAAHARQDRDHGWLGRIAVEPALHGARIGSQLVEVTADLLAQTGVAAALLDCELHRVSYYETKGFVVVDEFAGSVSNGLALMRRQLN